MTPSAPVQVSGYDEQDTVSVEVTRWVRLAQLVLHAERVDPDAELGVRARLLDEPLGVAPYERVAHAEDRGGDLAGVAASCAQWPRSTAS